MKDLASASRKEQQQFLDSFDEVLCDIDGVLWFILHEIPGSLDAIKSLRNLSKKIHFVSNNSTISSDKYFAKLKRNGYTQDKHDLVIPVLAIIAYLKRIDFDDDKELFVIAQDETKNEFKSAGFKINQDENSDIDTIQDLIKCSQGNENAKIGAVIVDYDLHFNFVKLQKAVSYLKRPDVIFITGGTEPKIAIGRNILLIGPKYLQQPIEDLSGIKPMVFAKPSFLLNDYITEKYDIKNPSKVLFIGDNLIEDMQFATKCGYQKLLVLSGLTKLNSLINNQVIPDDSKPDYYVESLKTLHEIIENLK